MPELRWTLLIIGVLFIAILAWWERRRPHQASRQPPHIGSEPRPVANNDPSWAADVESPGPRPGPHAIREPTLTLPEIRAEARTREPAPPRELPVVEIPDEMESEEAISEHKISEELDEISEEISRDASAESEEELDEEVEEEARELEAEMRELPVAGGEPSVTVAGPLPAAAGQGPTTAAASPSAAATELPPPVLNQVKPIVDWPPEDQRKLISLRLVARPPERFRGALVRQALAAEGFVLGDLDIFHKPDGQNRAVLSAASLTKPGTFDLETMDIQRFVGLNLFAVLPGPKSPRKTFEELLTTARMLNERLEGALQDEHGGPLTPMRIQALRDTLGVEAKP
jgi:cell division protein ZipA